MRSSAASALESEHMTVYIDSHAHLLSEEYDQDRDAVMARAEAAGVSRIMIMCTQAAEARRAMALCEADPHRFQAAYGIHPEDVNEASGRYEEFLEIIRDPRIAAVGEIGLDYHWVRDNRELQQEWFIRQIEAAGAVGKPILVHARDALQDTFDIMKAHHVRGVLHCYSGSAEMAREFTKLGYFIALGGAVTFRNARHSVEVCGSVDAAYLLSETDCPYMAPEPRRGTRNEPSNIPLITARMAEVRGISTEEMADQIAANYARLLGENHG